MTHESYDEFYSSFRENELIFIRTINKIDDNSLFLASFFRSPKK